VLYHRKGLHAPQYKNGSIKLDIHVFITITVSIPLLRADICRCGLNDVLYKTCSVLLYVLEQPSVDNSSEGLLKRGTQMEQLVLCLWTVSSAQKSVFRYWHGLFTDIVSTKSDIYVFINQTLKCIYLQNGIDISYLQYWFVRFQIHFNCK
jgi:hypothetical protein